MVMVPDAAKKVPMMFRAQIEGRCQMQYAKSGDAERWASEWVERSEATVPEFGAGVETREHRLTWRFVTNGGQDDGVIRPVIGARGIPFYPGSSMKGAFRQACEQMEREEKIPQGKTAELCGDDRQLAPGILRFHGGYPTRADWTERLVDVVHPQQDWQVKTHNTRSKSGGAFVQISLYQPELRFGISSTEPLAAEAWETIWQIWERALSQGIGCRVCAGYGQPETHTSNVLCRMVLRGRGSVSQLLDRTPEFRPNLFRAGLRGHALRIFGGLAPAAQAEAIVEELFGGIGRGGSRAGLLGMAFRELKPAIVTNETYDVTGEVRWLLMRSLPDDDRAECLKTLVRQLMQFAMLLGGFGKSWRRADHRLFLPDYDDHSIGCHWEWAGKRSPVFDNSVRKLDEVAPFIDSVRETAQRWMQMQRVRAGAGADWREAWRADRVQVWGRVAEDREDSRAIEWLHGEYSAEYRNGRQRVPLSIKGTSVTGGNIDNRLNIGRLWHRLYPVVLRSPDPNNPRKALPKSTNRYLELLTLFPDQTPEFDRFIRYLLDEQGEFELLWGDE